ncbi:MAG: hypothetical protein K6E47_16145 [Lachnospiraceae bacterium]|nr:hypothetical protein [Lachnospiraceae bacterium]
MFGKQERIRERELTQKGLYIENVSGVKNSGTFFLRISKAIILFMVTTGTITGFCDAFSFEYNKELIIIYTLLLSIIMGVFLYKKTAFFIGLAAIFGLMSAGIYFYSIYVVGGLREISDTVRETYADHYIQKISKDPNPYVTDGYLCTTVILLYIVAILLIFFTITIVRYSNFAETFIISFIILEIPMFIGLKPELPSLIMIMAGCIATGMLGKGYYGSNKIPLFKRMGFIRGRKLGKTSFTTVGSGLGVFITVGFSILFSLTMLIFSSSAYGSSLGVAEEESIKETADEVVKIVSVHGVNGLFDKYDNVNGINRGQLGGVSTIRRDNKTDLIVTYVPHNNKTVYIPGFTGIQYKGTQWIDRISTAEFPRLGFTEIDYIEPETIDSMDRMMKGLAMKLTESAKGKMQLEYVDSGFSEDIFPYYTFPSGKGWPSSDKEYEYHTRVVDYYPPDLVQYRNAEDDYMDIGLFGYIRSLRTQIKEIEVGETTHYNLYGHEYLDELCLKVPDYLDRFLEEFVDRHGYKWIYDKRTEDWLRDYYDGYTFRHGTDTSDWDIFYQYNEETEEYEILTEEIPIMLNVDDGTLNPGYYSYDSYYYPSAYSYYADPTESVFSYRSEMDQRLNFINGIDERRLMVCQAIKETFEREYEYSLSPGKTPEGEDYVRYFLETQKQGVCTHFASAAVMILRYLGIPARYVEGYCVPSSLVKQSGREAGEDIDGNEWFPQDNEYNPEKKAYTVEVSDRYAHAWVEVFLEGQGFVPFEVTPLSYLEDPDEDKQAETDTNNNSPSTRPNTPANTNNTNSNNNNTVSKDSGKDKTTDSKETSVKTERILTDPERLIKTGIIAVAIGILIWLAIVLMRKILRRIRYRIYYKKGEFEKLIYIRYCELVARLKRKKIITAENPLPMELCAMLAEQGTVKAGVKNETGNLTGSKTPERGYKDYEETFRYLEKVLYSKYRTNAEEYNEFYIKLKMF